MPLAMACERWMVRQASCCAAPYCAFSAGMPADGGRIEEDVRAGERREPRGFRIPLVPADERRDAAELRIEGAEAEIAGREVELLEEERIVRDVHLAVEAEQRAIGVDDRGGVVIEAGGALFEQRRDDDDAQFGGQRAEAVGGRARDGFGEIEQAGVFFAAEILRAEQFLQADDLRALARGFADLFDGMIEIRTADRGRRTSAPVRSGIFRESQKLF